MSRSTLLQMSLRTNQTTAREAGRRTKRARRQDFSPTAWVVGRVPASSVLRNRNLSYGCSLASIEKAVTRKVALASSVDTTSTPKQI